MYVKYIYHAVPNKREREGEKEFETEEGLRKRRRKGETSRIPL
jgi:hypothetical protein